MKNVSAAALSLALLLVASAPLASQQPAPAPAPAQAAAPAPAPSPVLTGMLDSITLTQAQQVRVDSILAQFRKEAPPLAPDKQPDEATLAKYRTLTQRSLDGVRAVLTREQQQVWDRNVEKVRAASVRVGP